MPGTAFALHPALSISPFLASELLRGYESKWLVEKGFGAKETYCVAEGVG